jgi:ElaB/YqjD/DUF883 family membrane-anchored ribosome-binding protein
MLNQTSPDPTLIRDRITTLEEEIGRLRDRLDTVLVSPAPTATDAREAQTARSSVRGRLEVLIEQVRDTLARLEL